MQNDNRSESIKIFEHSKADIFWGKYYTWLSLLGWVVIFLIEIVSLKGNCFDSTGQFQLLSVIFVLPLVAFLICLCSLIFLKQAYEVRFNLNQRTLAYSL